VSRFVFLSCLVTMLCFAEPHPVLRGTVLAEAGTDFSLLRIIVLDANARTELGESAIKGDGSFRVADLPPAVVEIQLLSPHGDPVLHHFAATPVKEQIELRLPGNNVAGGTSVSLYRLKYKPTEMARKHWERAVAALKRHNRTEAAPQLDLALQDSPDFADAHEHRGLIAMAAGQYSLAARHLVKAAEIDPTDAQFLSNAALACLATSREPEAERLVSERVGVGRRELVPEELRPTFQIDPITG